MKSFSGKILKYGDNHLKVTSTYVRLGDLFMAQKNYADAKINYQKCLSILEGKFAALEQIEEIKRKIQTINNISKDV